MRKYRTQESKIIPQVSPSVRYMVRLATVDAIFAGHGLVWAVAGPFAYTPLRTLIKIIFFNLLGFQVLYKQK